MNKYYVYLHCKATTGEVFYVGKGHDRRAESKDGRSKWWHRTVNKHGYIVKYCKKNLSENSAFDLEIELISKIGRRDMKKGTLINKTDGGEGVSGRIYTESEIKKLSIDSSGSNNGMYDHAVHEFHHNKYGVENSTRFDLQEKYGLSNSKLSLLISGKRKRHGGWSLGKAIDDFGKGELNARYDDAIYKFVRKDGTVEYATKLAMKQKYGMESTAISGIVTGRIRSTRGWFFDKYRDRNTIRDKTVYRFIHHSGKVENLTQYEMQNKYKISSAETSMVVSGKRKSTKGWFLNEVKARQSIYKRKRI